MAARRLPIVTVLFAVATMLSTPSFAKEDSREAALRKAEQARFDANVTADAKVLGELLSDDLEYTHSNGDFDTKSSFIESLTSGRRDYVKSDIIIQSVRIFGDVAVIRGKAIVTVADNGQSRDLDLRYLDVWKWQNGKWQMTSWQSARMPPSTAPAK
jgi:hypothetical protein